MLDSIFISYHFDDNGIRLAEVVKRLVISHNIKPVTGERLAGETLSEGVKSKINQCQAIIVLLTKREAGKTNDWVRDERAYASGKGLKFITLLEEDVSNKGMFSNNERIKVEIDDLAESIIELSMTINMWRSMSGQSKRFLLRPKDLSDRVSGNVESHMIKYRIWKKDNSGNMIPNWKTIIPTPATGGATLYIQGIQEDDLIEVEVNIDGEKWTSPAASHNVIVELNRRLS